MTNWEVDMITSIPFRDHACWLANRTRVDIDVYGRHIYIYISVLIDSIWIFEYIYIKCSMLHANPAQVIFQSRSLLGPGGSAPYIKEKHTHTTPTDTQRDTSPITNHSPRPLTRTTWWLWWNWASPYLSRTGRNQPTRCKSVWCWHHAVRVWSRQWCVYYSKYINVSYPPSTQKIYHLLVFSVFFFLAY